MGVDNFEMTTVDDYTVAFTFQKMDPAFLTHLALWCGFIVSEAAVTDLGEISSGTPWAQALTSL